MDGGVQSMRGRPPNDTTSVWDKSRSQAKKITDGDRAQWLNVMWSVFKQVVAASTEDNSVLCLPQLLSTLTLFAGAAEMKARRALCKQLYALPIKGEERSTTAVPVADYTVLWLRDLCTQALPGSFHAARRLLVHSDYTKSYDFETFTALRASAVDVKIVTDLTTPTDLRDWHASRLALDDLDITLPPKKVFRLWSTKEKAPKHAKCPILASVSRIALSLQKNALDASTYTVDFEGAGAVIAWKVRGTDSTPLRCVRFGDGELIQLPTVGDRLLTLLLRPDPKDGVEQLLHKQTLLPGVVESLLSATTSILTAVYLPDFSVFPAKAQNFGAALKAAMPGMESLFLPDGFSDLALKGGEARAGDHGAPSIQHWDYVGCAREQEFQPPPRKRPVVASSAGDRVINCPFVVAVWDRERHLPVYLVSIVRPGKTPDWLGQTESTSDKTQSARNTNE